MSSAEQSLASRRIANALKSSNASKSVSKKPSSLPPETVEYLKAWMMSPEHIAHPYPTDQEKARIMAETGIELKQLTNWFVNNRKRYWKPRVGVKLSSDESKGGASTLLGDTFQVEQTGSDRSTDVSSRDTNAVEQPSFGPEKTYSLSQCLPQLTSYVEDPHTISEGGSVISSSSTSSCHLSSSDDDSIEAGNNNTTSTEERKYTKFSVGGIFCGNTGNKGHHPIDSFSDGKTLRREVVDVHILRPECCGGEDESAGSVGSLPTLRDVTIQTNVKKEYIIATFPKCLLQYFIHDDIENDKEKVQIRRDVEVLRVKKHYLKLYLATRGIHSVSSFTNDSTYTTTSGTCAENFHRRNDIEDARVKASSTIPDDEFSSVPTHFSSQDSQSTTLSLRKRAGTVNDVLSEICDDDSASLIVRKRARTSSELVRGEDEWRELCQNASSLFCESLPGLEEAAVMFGYATH